MKGLFQTFKVREFYTFFCPRHGILRIFVCQFKFYFTFIKMYFMIMVFFTAILFISHLASEIKCSHQAVSGKKNKKLYVAVFSSVQCSISLFLGKKSNFCSLKLQILWCPFSKFVVIFVVFLVLFCSG